MTLGAFGFEALGFGYADLGRNLSTPWTWIEVAAVMDRPQWTGPTSSEVTIKGVLFPRHFGGQGSLNGIKAAAEAGEPLMLVTGDASEGVISGLFVIEGVDEDTSLHDGMGAPRRNAYSIKLRRAGEGMAGGSILNALVNLFG